VALVRQDAGALLLGTDTTFFNRRDRLIAVAARFGIPAIYTFRDVKSLNEYGNAS
jgi:hypothetical protein